MNPKTRTCLWFQSSGFEAAQFYVSLFPGSDIERTFQRASDTEPLVIDFTLTGTPYQILCAGPHFKLTEAASISVATKDQAETDHLWETLTANGGEESQCGWLKDRYGLSWQIVPQRWIDLMHSPDGEAMQRGFDALMQMKKIDLATLEKAFAGK